MSTHDESERIRQNEIRTMRREIRRLRKLARDLYFNGDFYGSHELGCACEHCLACEHMRSRGHRAP